MQITDIVVPVYNAVEDLIPCVDSVLRNSRAGTFRLILIDDASPNYEVADYFQRQAELRINELVLLRNEKNLGFVATANRGMSLHPECDVVLLNSDTLVTSGWLDRIRRCASSDPAIGTITPFSNNAEICSFPHFCRNNLLDDIPPIESIGVALGAGTPIYPNIPTAIGFCMYIRRALIEIVGMFDVETFGLGYGEENDFCMRASASGFRNVLCDDAFVAHTGGRSFTDRKQALMLENGRRLLARYPHYDDLIQDFVRRDPLQDIRDRAWARLEHDAHSNKRGVSRWIPFWQRWFP